MSKRSTHHATFVIERDYAAPPARVYGAWADSEAKARWFVGPEDWEKSDHALDFIAGVGVASCAPAERSTESV